MPGRGVLVTGGSGLLGGELKRLLPDADFPSSGEFDVTDYPGMVAYAERRRPRVVLHGAAFTSPPKVEEDPGPALEVNIIGTANVVRLCTKLEARLVYISTDYVFRGDRGRYREDDELSPVNKYAWSKLGGECAVRLYDHGLIVRTTFGPAEFPYPKAFADQWTSRESVVEVAAKIAALLEVEATGVVHVGGPRRTVLEFARSLDPEREIGSLSTADVDFPVPRDTSLDTERFERLVGAAEPGKKRS